MFKAGDLVKKVSSNAIDRVIAKGSYCIVKKVSGNALRLQQIGIPTAGDGAWFDSACAYRLIIENPKLICSQKGIKQFTSQELLVEIASRLK